MFRKKYDLIIAVQNDDVCWICRRPGINYGKSFRMPLEQILDDEKSDLILPQWLKGKYKSLCIFPDHWFGLQTYPFRSKKRSLIEPFLERKLSAANPEHDAIRHFFNYRHIDDHQRQELVAVFFQEDKSYQLYTALENLNHCPHEITAPAFLWEDQLQHADGDFIDQGTLLVHHAGRECHLYFYHKGHYQFSRIVNLSDTADDLDALGFEINQSLYMFSQKAKSELDRIYIFCDKPHCQQKLGEALGREIIDLSPLLAKKPGHSINTEIETLDGLLQESQMYRSAGFFGVMNRHVKKVMEWQLVQWTGIIIGFILLIGISGEHLLLRKKFDGIHHEYQLIQQRIINNSQSSALSEYASNLDQLLTMAKQTEFTQAAHRIPAVFPTGISLKELEFRIDAPPTVKVTADVQAHNADDLQAKLNLMITRIKAKYKQIRMITLNDIEIHMNRPGEGTIPNRYQITFQLEWT